VGCRHPQPADRGLRLGLGRSSTVSQDENVLFPCGSACESRQRQILTPIASALQTSPQAEPNSFEATLVAWRRANTQATFAFLDEMMATSP
jgi:hypothetical protein